MSLNIIAEFGILMYCLKKFDGKYTMREPMCLQIADYSEVSDGETDHHATAVDRYKELFGE